MAVSPYNPGFSETPPFSCISSVKWNNYRLVAFWLAQNGPSPQFFLQWVGPKPYYTQGELKELERNGQMVQVPVFGARQTIHTGTVSANGSYTFPTGFPPVPVGTNTITGDYLHSTGPARVLDYRGYAKVDGHDMQMFDNGTGTPTVLPIDAPGSEYWNFEGVKIVAADYPSVPVLVRGQFIASDDVGDVYVYQTPIDVTKRGITKYSRETGEVLWKIDSGFETVRYDENAQRIYLYYFNLPTIHNPGIEIYNLNGIKLSAVDLGNDYSAEDISRNGKFYTFGPSDLDHSEGIYCFGPTGSLLWTIPGEDLNDGGNFWGPILAYGEDYLVVEIQRNMADPPDHVLAQRHHGWRVYNAHTGTLVSSGVMADDVSTYETIGGSGFDSTIIHNSISYGETNGLVRGAYWP